MIALVITSIIGIGIGISITSYKYIQKGKMEYESEVDEWINDNKSISNKSNRKSIVKFGNNYKILSSKE